MINTDSPANAAANATPRRRCPDAPGRGDDLPERAPTRRRLAMDQDGEDELHYRDVSVAEASCRALLCRALEGELERDEDEAYRAYTLVGAFTHFMATLPTDMDGSVEKTYYIEEPGHNIHGFMELTTDNSEEIEVASVGLLPLRDETLRVLVRAIDTVLLSQRAVFAEIDQITLALLEEETGLLPTRTWPHPDYELKSRVFAFMNDSGFRGLIENSNGSEEFQLLNVGRAYTHLFKTRRAAALAAIV